MTTASSPAMVAEPVRRFWRRTRAVLHR
ncbi:hypothetical protein M6B38_129230 [Iris pallida]|uniref:ABC transporter permease n=1 Tax=Iris pallida TaxID=29817 RepID=A0AAX6G679_IRIPA|nr:hypothetical protein M6B38_129230 [Iris pallida]